MAKKARHSLQDCIADPERAMELAEISGNVSAYAQAAMNKAKLLGHVTQKAEVRTGQLGPEEAKPDISAIWARTIGKAEDQSAAPTITH